MEGAYILNLPEHFKVTKKMSPITIALSSLGHETYRGNSLRYVGKYVYLVFYQVRPIYLRVDIMLMTLRHSIFPPTHPVIYSSTHIGKVC